MVPDRWRRRCSSIATCGDSILSGASFPRVPQLIDSFFPPLPERGKDTHLRSRFKTSTMRRRGRALRLPALWPSGAHWPIVLRPAPPWRPQRACAFLALVIDDFHQARRPDIENHGDGSHWTGTVAADWCRKLQLNVSKRLTRHKAHYAMITVLKLHKLRLPTIRIVRKRRRALDNRGAFCASALRDTSAPSLALPTVTANCKAGPVGALLFFVFADV